MDAQSDPQPARARHQPAHPEGPGGRREDPAPPNSPELPSRAGAESSSLQGTIELVTFHNEENLYSVLKVSPEEGFDDPQAQGFLRSARVTAVGHLTRPSPGLRVRLEGHWSSHKSHGRQFEFESCELLPPVDAEGVVRYLASSAFSGVGETLARRIVETLGTDALTVIQTAPERLAEVKGLKPAVREGLATAVRAEFERHHTHAFLRGLGLGPRQSQALIERFGQETEACVRRDPYSIAGALPGIGFALADRIALSLGFAPDGPERTRAALLHALRDAAGDGHSLLNEERLHAALRELLDAPVCAERFEAAVASQAQAGNLVVEAATASGAEATRAFYLPHLAASETGLANSVARLVARENRPLADAARVARAEAHTGLTLDPEQRDAVIGLLREPLALLTGGPGVGKTTIVRLLVALAEASGARVLLASPTGRAAKRLSEATGRPASTLHRALEFDPARGTFARDRERPLEADLVVVDEVSMLDVVLAHHLLKAVQAPTRLVLIGDPDQLPSVAPGNVLRDLIDSGAVPCHRLTRIHRQGRGSRIVENAHRILEGREPELPPRGELDSDFYFFVEEDAQRAADRVVEVVTERIPRTFGLDWARDVQVLAPMYRGECGVDALNERLRAARRDFGPDLAPEIVHRGRGFAVGDRVIQTRNDYEKEVFNGDMGLVARVDEDGLVVAYPEGPVSYARDALGDLQPAFAITVHRSQGSEYPAVVIPLVTQHFLMLQRNLLYTAVTRAKRLVVLVGSRRALRVALDNADPSFRLSGLAQRLRRPEREDPEPPVADPR